VITTGVQLCGQLDVERVGQAEAVTARPCTDKEPCHRMIDNGHPARLVHECLDRGGVELATAVTPTERREDLGARMAGRHRIGIGKLSLDPVRRWSTDEEVDQSRRVGDDQPTHGLLVS
jgi:hypothetical protein